MILIANRNLTDSDDRAPGDPTPDQIARRAAAIRRQWTPFQRERRRIFSDRLWMPPTVPLADLEANLSSGQANLSTGS